MDIWRNYHEVNVTRLDWWLVNIGSGTGLVLSGNKPLPEPMLTQISVVILRRFQQHKKLITPKNKSHWKSNRNIHFFSKKIHLKMSSAKCRPLCLASSGLIGQVTCMMLSLLLWFLNYTSWFYGSSIKVPGPLHLFPMHPPGMHSSWVSINIVELVSSEAQLVHWGWCCAIITQQWPIEVEWYMHQLTTPSLVQIMSCRLISAKPLSEPMLEYCQLDPWEQISVKF